MKILAAGKRNRMCGWPKFASHFVSLAIAPLDDNRLIGAVAIICMLCCLYKFCVESCMFNENTTQMIIYIFILLMILRVHLTIDANKLDEFDFENSQRSIYAIHDCACSNGLPETTSKLIITICTICTVYYTQNLFLFLSFCR